MNLQSRATIDLKSDPWTYIAAHRTDARIAFDRISLVRQKA